MKKIILFVLLVAPLILYVYFSMVKHNSLFLPKITKNVNELPSGSTLDDKAVHLTGKISIIGFPGDDITPRKEAIFNLNQKINAKYRGFTDFQMVMLLPTGDEQKVTALQESLKRMGDISDWKFVFANPADIRAFHASLKVKEPLDAQCGSPYVYIIDKERALRGRKGTDSKGAVGFKDGYNMFIVSELHNDMTDDVKIMLREYRLALKQNNVYQQAAKRKI
ncbi:MAG: hypothetical protein ACOVRN_19315 [Flavobacterium sp.]